jgi:hypothetical protein
MTLVVFAIQFLSSKQEEEAGYALLELLAPNANCSLKAVSHDLVLRAGVSEEH